MKIYSLVFLFLFIACKPQPEIQAKEVKVTSVSNTDIETEKTPENNKSKTALSLEEQGLVNIHSLDKEILIDLKYATTDNFTKTILYEDLTEAYLHPIAAEKLIKAQQLLKKINSEYTLLVYDAARPLSIQRKMYEVVQNTPYKAYVASPERTSIHNYGMAVDITISHKDGTLLDMGTPFDYFGKAAGINQEEQLYAERVLTRSQIDNRKLLRKIMSESGFIPIRGEWWHFNAVSLNQAKKMTQIIE